MQKCEHTKTPQDIFLNIRPDGQCKICRHNIYKRHYESNKLKILAKHKKYREENPEKIKALRERYKVTGVILYQKRELNLSKMVLCYANKLKNILCEIAKTEREYKHYRRLAYNCDEKASGGYERQF